METSVPILPSRDLEESLSFYEALGFENRGAPPNEWGYLILGRGELWLHVVLDEAVDPLATASACYLYVDDSAALHRAWAEVVVPDPATGRRIHAPMVTDYGMLEFAVVDSNGNLLRVGSEIG